MRALDWTKENWKPIAQWGGLAGACLAVLALGFVSARYIAAGQTFDGDLKDLAPQDVSMVMTVGNVPVLNTEFERFLDDLVANPKLAKFEQSSLWEDNLGKSLGGSLEEFRSKTYRQGLDKSQQDANELGVELFDDVLAGELVICTDPSPTEDGRGEFVMLSRISRGVRLKWQFLDMASWYFPDDPNQPKLEYERGILKLTPRPSNDPDAPPPATTMIVVLDDVLIISDSNRLLNDTLANHPSGGGISRDEGFTRTLNLVAPESRERHGLGVWLNLDRMRKRLPPEENDDGKMVSPVDTFNSLPNSVIAVYPDIFSPVNQILSMNLDTRPFQAAYYGVDVSQPGELKFDQYLLVNDERISARQYDYLRKTWDQNAAPETQFKLLPPDTMMQVSYRQPLDVLYNEVFNARTRTSLVGDFVVALNGANVKARMTKEPEELMFASLPRSYAEGVSMPLSGTDLPLPGFAIAFRTPGAQPDVAQALLKEYLQVQRGRTTKPGDAPQETKEGPVQVVRKDIAGNVAFGFHDPREGENFLRSLNRSIRSALIGEWLILTNSEKLLEYAFSAHRGVADGLIDAPGSPLRELPDTSNASIYLNFNEFAEYAGSRELFKILRDSKYNPTLIEGRDPGELRREIARKHGYDPEITENLLKPEVKNEYERRKIAWQQTCQIEGNRYEAELKDDMEGLKFFRDLALVTKFAPDHLHVQGLLRVE